MIQNQGEFYSGRSCNNIHESVGLLDLFTKSFCIDVTAKDDLVFNCNKCPFQTTDERCLCKVFKNEFDPTYKDFGAMGDL